MAKLTLSDVSSIVGNETSAAATINANHDLIEAAVENTLSRDGTSPNTMETDLDMNSNDVNNVGTITADTVDVTTLTYNGVSASAAGISWQNAWATSTAYSANDGVENDGSGYICILAHTSGASTEPGTGASWETYWDLFASKGDTGGMSAATYDPGTVSEQLVGLTATQTLTNKTLTTPTLTLKQSSSPTPTAEGDVQWDTDDDTLVIGDGSSQVTFGTVRGQHSLLIPASAFRLAGAGNDATQETVDTGNFSYYTWRFASGSDVEIQTEIPMPRQWAGGNVKWQLYWFHPAATAYGIDVDAFFSAMGNGDSLEQANGSADNITDTGGSTNTLYISSVSTGVAVNGATANAGEMLRMHIINDNANSTIDANWHLLGVKLYFTTDKELDT